VTVARLHLITESYLINGLGILSTTLSAPCFAALPNVSYALVMSFIAKR